VGYNGPRRGEVAVGDPDRHPAFTGGEPAVDEIRFVVIVVKEDNSVGVEPLGHLEDIVVLGCVPRGMTQPDRLAGQGDGRGEPGLPGLPGAARDQAGTAPHEAEEDDATADL
jgi:hypothetical protein